MKYAYIFLISISLALTVLRVFYIYKWSKKNGHDKDSYQKFLASEAGKIYRTCGKVIAAALLLALIIYSTK